VSCFSDSFHKLNFFLFRKQK